ncbi:ADP-ribose 1''-phosphate phosphatase [Teratosphaeria destructans]|uniref:ADP-ribose 1''-phosphate phosphatase n=1 Tax=Teratosphaeria destructans TaxID=418781 RepID=A0A9W7VYC7_9PEZI|nr:ADP-ribose 1''-phosphate phosphatase [Teratosphaeria destructans]
MTLDKWLEPQAQPSTHNTTSKRKADPSNNTAPPPQKRAKANTGRKMKPHPHAPATNKSKTPDLPKNPTNQPPPPTPSINPTPSPTPTTPLKITEHPGDLFAAPPNTLLIHACNTLGAWSAGIASAFKSHYPVAYRTYAAHCKAHTPDQLRGTALLIPPAGGKERHWIGCLFTSRKYGRGKDGREQILEATGEGMRDLVVQVGEMEGEAEEVGEVWMCRVNSGKFGVPWEATRRVLEGVEVAVGSKVREVKVVSRD